MGYARLAVYLVGLIVVVLAAWVFLTQTAIGDAVPAGVALALILLLVGVGVMASARNINDRRTLNRVVRDSDAGPRTYAGRDDDPYAPPHTETVIEERRYD